MVKWPAILFLHQLILEKRSWLDGLHCQEKVVNSMNQRLHAIPAWYILIGIQYQDKKCDPETHY